MAGGVAGNIGGSMMGNDLVGRIGVGGLAGGVGAWAAGGDFAQGFQAGAYNGAFNWALDEGVGALHDGLKKIDAFLSKKDISIGGTVDYFGVNVSVGIGQGPLFQKAIQTPNLGLGVYASWNPGGGKNLVTYGKWGVGGGPYFDKNGITGGYFYFGDSVIPASGYRSF